MTNFREKAKQVEAHYKANTTKRIRIFIGVLVVFVLIVLAVQLVS